MNDPVSILNPFLNPIFIQVLKRTIYVFLIGFLLVLILNKFKFKGLWKTNVGERYLSWLLIGPIYLATIFLGGNLALLVLAIILIMAIWEISKITKLPKQYIIAMYLLAAFSVYIASYQNKYFYSLPLVYYLVFSSLAIQQNDAKKSFSNLSIATFISIWLIFSLSHFVLLGHLNNALDASLGLTSTKSLLILLGFAVPLSDVFAYVVGSFFHKINFLDKYKIASNLSKHKTYIGTLGNIIGAGIGIWIMQFALGYYLPYYHWIILTILIGIMGVMGDITESLLKRHYNTKDSGQLIPGHGGILDRIDSVLRVIIVVYYYLIFFV
jgi:phosphatidate cytidylyltransferase